MSILNKRNHDHGHECGGLKRRQKSKFPYVLDVQKHEQALIASYKVRFNCNADKSEHLVEEFMQKIGDAVNALGGYIGHIKAFVTYETPGIQLTLTSDIVSKIAVPARTAYVEGVAIVFCINYAQFEKVLIESLNLLSSYFSHDNEPL